MIDHTGDYVALDEDDPRKTTPGENLAVEWENEPNADALWDALDLAKKDAPKAIGLLEDLVERGSSLAPMYLGSLFFHGRYGIEPDTKIAKSWWRLGSSMGSIESSFCLARQLELEGDYPNAEKEYRQMAERQFSPAFYALGRWYYKGEWFEKNVTKSIEYFEEAEKRGHLWATLWIAYIFENEKLGLLSKPRGWMKRIAMMIPFVRCKVGFPNSDRLRI